MGIAQVRIKRDEIRKIVRKIVNQAHIVISINKGKLYPVTREYMVIREENPEIQAINQDCVQLGLDETVKEEIERHYKNNIEEIMRIKERIYLSENGIV